MESDLSPPPSPPPPVPEAAIKTAKKVTDEEDMDVDEVPADPPSSPNVSVSLRLPCVASQNEKLTAQGRRTKRKIVYAESDVTDDDEFGSRKGELERRCLRSMQN